VTELSRSPIGVVPILWNNTDIAGLAPLVPASVVLDEAARLGFDGVQDGVGFPSGTSLRLALADRRLRLAEVYAALPCGPDGPAVDALERGARRLDDLHAAGGEVLVVALGFSQGRLERAGRAHSPDTPQLSERGWANLAGVLETLGRRSRDLGHRLAFHPHAGTYVETPAEVARVLESCDPDVVGICLDTGHYIVGEGDPVTAIREFGSRVSHVHLKDVAPDPLRELRKGSTGDFFAAIRARIFTELGSGVLDLPAVLAELALAGYGGWLMVEQDSTWNPPSESAAISRRVLEFALRLQGQGRLAA
jgi:inosose dehydratase